MNTADEQLQTYLLESNLVSQKDIEEATKDAESHKLSLREALINKGLLSEKKLQEFIAQQEGLPFVDLTKQEVTDEILKYIPEPMARRHNVVAFDKKGDELCIALLDPQQKDIVESLRKANDLVVTPYITDSESIQKVLAQYRKTFSEEFQNLVQPEIHNIKDAKEADENLGETELKQLAQDLPVIKIVDAIIVHALQENASDIHIEPEEDALVVRYRIDGILHDSAVLPSKITPGVVARIKVLSNLRLDEKRLPQDGRFKKEIDNEEISFRVSTLPTYFGEKVVIRLLKESSHGFSLSALGLHGVALEHVHSAMKQKTGLILVSGPTGSGKTTTLYTMLDILNTTDVNISTVEDPIEYQVDRINQTQVRSEIGLTFAAGLRSLLRQDPDILMVGEIRDKETVSLAVNAALTGHLVLSTIHTNSAAGVIPRMLDMGIEPFLLTSTIKTITAQRLVRVLADSKEEYFLSEEELKELEEVVDLDRVLTALREEKIVDKNADWSNIPFYRAQPSTQTESGYHGRIGIHEVLHVSDEIKKLISQNASQQEVENVAKQEGMLTMIEDGIFKCVQGLTTTEEVLRVVSE